jgi:hypothetical protein
LNATQLHQVLIVVKSPALNFAGDVGKTSELPSLDLVLVQPMKTPEQGRPVLVFLPSPFQVQSFLLLLFWNVWWNTVMGVRFGAAWQQ